MVGFDDIQMAEFTEPPLTTVRLQQSEVARLACNALLQLIRTPGMGAELGRRLHVGDSLFDCAIVQKNGV